MGIQVKLEAFEGPLDLLLHLIEKNKVDIYDIPIVSITEQYMDYIAGMKKRDLDVASEFLVMAATLLEIKSRMLLPVEPEEEGEEEDPRAELVQQLLEYKMYKRMSMELKDRAMDADRVWYKLPTIPEEVLRYEEPVDLQKLIGNVTLARLNSIFRQIMRRVENRVDPIRSKFGTIKQEEVTLEECMEELKLYARKHRSFGFRQLLEKKNSRMQLIVTFLAILELMKTGEIRIEQSRLFDDIRITSLIAA
ncbi:MAG: segregation/condensation protein A [Lachnospiraceae bacterium]|nr:segregation/condensation protein A [Lachnospiraceae bacterium]